MPIVIKELFPSDPLSEALEKINFNFDQVILAGGGPPGPIGPQGVPGIPGPQGERGDHWQVGVTAPTSDHGPSFGSLKDFDFWISATGQVYYWSIGASSWISSGTNLTGPQGASGATGGAFELGMYQGSTGNANTPGSSPAVGGTNYTPGISGATTVASGGVDFIIPVNIDKNSFFLGASGWAYNNLNNFGVYDVDQPVNIQRLTPKQVIIQTGIDYTGLGGLSIGAYGATSSVGSTLSDYLGDPTAVTDALNFFTAGFAIKPGFGDYAHVFRMRTGTIDLEIQAGDTNFAELAAGKTPDLILRSTRTIISDFTSAQITIGATSTMFREKVAIGYSSLPTFDSGSTFDNFGKGRSRGDFYIGALNGSTNSLGVGYGRTVNGAANVNLYTNGTTPTSETFSIFRASGQDGVGRITQVGAGFFEFNHIGTGDIKFSTTGVSTERMRITTGGTVGIGTPSPITKLEVVGAIRSSGNAGLPNDVTNNAVLAGGFTSPDIGRLYIGNGTGWKFNFSRRVSSVDTDLVTIVDSGFVGIGESNPSDKLDVKDGNISINDSSLAVQGIGRGIKFENGTSVSSSINLYRGSATNNVGLSFVNANVGATSEAMRIHPTGVISIGNSTAHLNTPTYRVHIQDNTEVAALIRSNSSGAGARNNLLFQRKNGTSSAVTTDQYLGGISFGGYDGTNWTSGTGDGGAEITSRAHQLWSSGNRPAYISLSTTSVGSSSALERMRIMDSGFVGIGTTTPLELLQVAGNIHVSGGNRTIFNRNTNSLAFGTSNTQRIIISSGGNVGIGSMVTPNNKFEISSGSFVHGSNTALSGNRAKFFVNNSAGSGAEGTEAFAITYFGATGSNFSFYPFSNSSSFVSRVRGYADYCSLNDFGYYSAQGVRQVHYLQMDDVGGDPNFIIGARNPDLIYMEIGKIGLRVFNTPSSVPVAGIRWNVTGWPIESGRYLSNMGGGTTPTPTDLGPFTHDSIIHVYWGTVGAVHGCDILLEFSDGVFEILTRGQGTYSGLNCVIPAGRKFRIRHNVSVLPGSNSTYTVMRLGRN
jgi:hypothetical protein